MDRQEIIVSEHAIERYKQRLGSKKDSLAIKNKIKKMFALAEKQYFEYSRWLKYGRKNGDIYAYSNIYFVVRKGAIITLWQK